MRTANTETRIFLSGCDEKIRQSFVDEGFSRRGMAEKNRFIGLI